MWILTKTENEYNAGAEFVTAWLNEPSMESIVSCLVVMGESGESVYPIAGKLLDKGYFRYRAGREYELFEYNEEY